MTPGQSGRNRPSGTRRTIPWRYFGAGPAGDCARLGAAPAPGLALAGGGCRLCEWWRRPRLAATLGDAALPGPVGAPARTGASPETALLSRLAATLGDAANPGAAVWLGWVAG
jgi:hypothetical protein